MGLGDTPPPAPTSGNVIPAGSSPFFATVDPNRQGAQGDVHWKLETIEPSNLKFKNFTIKGQLPVGDDGISIRMNQQVASAGIYGSPLPIIQWVRGELQVISFDVMLFSRDVNEDINGMFQEMTRVQEYSSELKRIPVCRFTYGDIVSVKCIVSGFGEVRIARPKGDGKARQIKFPITLERFSPYEIKEVDKNKPPKKSRMQVASSDRRMYEVLARREYGSDAAIYGDRLRKLNRTYPFAVDDGGLTKIPSGSVILSERIYPEFHGFNLRNEDTAAMILDRFDARNARFLVR